MSELLPFQPDPNAPEATSSGSGPEPNQMALLSEERLQLALRGAGQGIWDWDLTAGALIWDQRCKEIFGLPADFPVTYEWHLNALHPDDRQQVADAIAAALQKRSEFIQEYRTFHPDGKMRWVLARGQGYYDTAGEPCRMSGTVMDISDRKQAELALQESEQRYRFLVEHTSDMVFRIGLRQPLPLDLPLEQAVDWIFREAVILAINDGFLRAYGYERPEELVGQPMTVVVPRTPENEAMERALIANGHSIIEARTEELDRQGERKVMLNSIVGRIENGYVYDYIGTARDITERVLAEEALAAEEQRYRYIFESVGVAIWEVDFSEVKAAIDRLRSAGIEEFQDYFAAHPEFVESAIAAISVFDLNNVALQITGAASREQLLARLNEIYLPETIQTVVGQLLATAAGETAFQAETVIRTLQGQRRYVLLTVTFPPAGKPYDRVLVTWTDISDRKQAELALREQEQQLQQLSDSMPQFVWMSNAQGQLDYVNRQWLDYSGLTLEQSRDPVQVALYQHPDDRQAAFDQWAQAVETQQIYEQEMRLKRASDGTYRWFLVRAVPILDQQGQVQRWFGTSTDIHDRKLAELNSRFLNELDSQLRQLSDAEAMVWTAVNRLGNYLQVDHCLWHKVDGQRQLAIVDSHWRRPDRSDLADLSGTYALADLFTPAQLARFAAGQTLVVADVATHPDTAAYAQQYPPCTTALIAVPCIQGDWIATLSVTASQPRSWLPDQVTLLQDAVARLWPLIQQAQAAQALRESELKFRTLADNIAQLAWIADENGSIFWYNQRWFDYTGTTLEEMQGWGWQQVHHPDHLERVVTRIRHCFATGEIWEDTFPLRRHDGQYRWFLSRAVPIRDDQGQVWRWFGTNTDITERQQAEADLQERNSHIQLLYETTRDLLSTDRPLTLIDSVFTKLKALIGLDVYFNYLLDQDQQRLQLGFYGGISNETAQQIEWLEVGRAICGTVAQQQCQILQFDLQSSTEPKAEVVRALGLTAYACQPLVAQGKLFGTLGFGSRSRSRFTTAETQLFQAICDQIAIALERAELMTSLQRQTTELRQANHLKDEFLAALSHELRTPLNPILGWTKLMQGQKLTAQKTTEALATIERNVKQQISLVSDLLDLSSVIQGDLYLDLQPIDLSQPLQMATETVQPAAQAKGITISLFQTETAHWVRADRNRLRQVFWNLLANAVKFTPDGGRIEIKISRIEVENSIPYVQVCITDNGIGIDPIFLPYVFERFRQADGSSTRKYGGLGLGLSIVRHLVELQGGTVTAASLGLGQGASFAVKLPLCEVAKVQTSGPEQPAFASTQQLPLPLSGVQILLVDDDADNLDLLRFLLQQSGAVVTAVPSPLEALQLVSETFPQLIISDIGMPEMSGYEFIQQVRALRPNQPIPSLAFTAFAGREDQTAALTAGFQAHISKPVDPLQFLAVIQQLASS